jgi:hypothetical protein
MAALWTGVLSGSAQRALTAFFPVQAYVQAKDEGAAEADWRYRLFGDFAVDLRAARQLLGTNPGRARLLGVRAVASYAHWVPPGTCFNRTGYWELPNARVVYRQDGAVRSFGIASLISWRGQWYVVHLGAVERESQVGVVDEPASGGGASTDSGTC